MSIVVEYEGRWDDMDWDEKKSYERYQELEKLRLQVEQTKAATELATVSPGEEIARIEMTEKKEIEIRRIEMMEKTMPWKTAFIIKYCISVSPYKNVRSSSKMVKIASGTASNSRYHYDCQPYARESRRKDRIQVKNGLERPLSSSCCYVRLWSFMVLFLYPAGAGVNTTRVI